MKQKFIILFTLLIIFLFSYSFSLSKNFPTTKIIIQNLNINMNSSFKLGVEIKNVTDLYGIGFDIKFDKKFLDIIDIYEGEFLKSDNKETLFLKKIDKENAFAQIGLSRVGKINGVSGSGIIIYIEFRALNIGSTKISLENITLKDSNLNKIDYILEIGEINISLPDNNPPKINISILDEVYFSPYLLSGTIIDEESGVKTLRINENEIPVLKNGYFGYFVNLNDGLNLIKIEGEDNAGNVTSKILNIFYKKDIDKISIKMQIGNKVAFVNGLPYELEVPPTILPPGRTVVPLRFISESFGANVEWDNSTKSILLNIDSINSLNKIISSLKNQIHNLNTTITQNNNYIYDLYKIINDKDKKLEELEEKIKDIEPPTIVIYEPNNNSIFKKSTITIRGCVKDNSKVDILKINNNIVPFDLCGNFEYVIQLNEGKNDIIIEAKDSSNNIKKLNIIVYFEKPKGWELTEDQIIKAINWGKTNKNNFYGLIQPFLISPMAPYQTFLIINTPYFWVSYAAKDKADKYQDYTLEDAYDTLKIWGDKLCFSVYVYGDSIDFAKNFHAVIEVNGKYIQPYEVKNTDWAERTNKWPFSPAYYAMNGYLFYNSEIPRKDKIKFILIRIPTDKEEIFEIDLSKIP